MIDIKIALCLSVLHARNMPEIMVSLDHDLLPLTVTGCDTAKVEFIGKLDLGLHAIEIAIDPERDLNQVQRPAMLSIDHVYFQDVEHDFRDQGLILHTGGAASSCPGNRVCVGDLWRLDFQVPVYRWMHQKMNLGWLI